MPKAKIGAHVEVFKDDERTGKRHLVHTSRPCRICGKAVEDAVVPEGEGFVHLKCKRSHG